jgi:hypothetical protein
MPDMQDFDRVLFHAVGDDMRQAPVKQFSGALLASLATTQGNFLRELADLRISMTVGRAK